MTRKKVFVRLMPRNILIDLNVVLDIVLDRPLADSAELVLNLQAAGSHELYLSADSVTTFAYLLERAKKTNDQIKFQIDWLLKTFRVVAVTAKMLHKALSSQITDYEDAVVEQAALACNAEAIITGNDKDFAGSAVPALKPALYYKQLKGTI